MVHVCEMDRACRKRKWQVYLQFDLVIEAREVGAQVSCRFGDCKCVVDADEV